MDARQQPPLAPRGLAVRAACAGSRRRAPAPAAAPSPRRPSRCADRPRTPARALRAGRAESSSARSAHRRRTSGRRRGSTRFCAASVVEPRSHVAGFVIGDEAHPQQRVVHFLGRSPAAARLPRARARRRRGRARRCRRAIAHRASAARCTACVRRSSSGASSRNVYSSELRMPRANADGSGVSTATRLDRAVAQALEHFDQARRCRSLRSGSRRSSAARADDPSGSADRPAAGSPDTRRPRETPPPAGRRRASA